jgi:hypothetical protein
MQPIPPPCPLCGKRNKVTRTGAYWHCNNTPDCGLFDDDPDEGGTHSDDPTRRMMRREDARERRRERFGSRR